MRFIYGRILFFLSLSLSFSVFWHTFHNRKDTREKNTETQLMAFYEGLLAAEERGMQLSRKLRTILDTLKDLTKEQTSSTTNQTVGDADMRYGAVSFNKMSNAWIYLPHLKDHEDSLTPNVLVGKGRTGVSLVLGIPTVKREKQSYLISTLGSLFYELSLEELTDIVVIVFVAEVCVTGCTVWESESEGDDCGVFKTTCIFDPKQAESPDCTISWDVDSAYVQGVAESIKTNFPDEVKSGILEVVTASPHFYPSFSQLKETFGDSKERVQWRTKQNLDYSFLMLYAQQKGSYYVQLEDDIVAKAGYLQAMKTFAKQNPEDWLILEFSQLGFIGKMFRTSDLPMLVEFILMFYKDKPIDWLLDHVLWVKVCHPEQGEKDCGRKKDVLRRRYKPSLFQHIGIHSSLKGKIQKLKDRDFGKQTLFKAHTNPPAELKTSLTAYQSHTLERAYLGQDFFWGMSPVLGDFVEISFHQPQPVKGYLFRSGNIETNEDKFYNTTVEVLPSDSSVLQKIDKHPSVDGFIVIGAFVNGVAEGTIDPLMEQISAIRLVMHSDSDVWALLSEIFIRL